MKKLIIVCEEKLRQYGDFLAQLVSLQDDKGEEIVGVKDGTVAAQVWTEKEYTANAPQISSEQYILFIGNSKLLKEKRAHMQAQFSQYGMNYGWLGKQAALFVDQAVNLKEYNNFIEFAQGNQPEIKRLVDTKVKVFKEDTKKELLSIKNFAANVVLPGFSAMRLAVTSKKEVESQQYSCLTLLFYLKGLAAFLGLNEQ